QDPESITAIEISFDQGANWTRFDTSDATSDRWVYWYFNWTPPMPGAYVISVRAIRADGVTTPYPVEKLINVQ
ncbi:MAG: oxidoreductase, partial [Clostridia bacterium]|nr:oxidoreductase [Clostridia bacterium]